MQAEAFIRPDMDVRFSTVERAEDVVPTILAARASPAAKPKPRPTPRSSRSSSGQRSPART